ncbi:S-adenosyl-L-methionine-dependent methyltransferase [Mollisia scopiformis]|uniref:S-adenosyl-L-methionine-dependent methyltransferase n=1 Tax=Mollisia scopiformis TaxID=149040 RepID=A0A132B2Q1_MOLSC|nr:S-adenosyl-L-methionine-dependent methyltransferase [Mollisia scopiformis]KUJ06319.1 S-adenosyl-L-methionine-dependent methyltransferase [Mollisia scopiformis]
MSYLSILRTSLNDKLQQLETQLSASIHSSSPHLLEAYPYLAFDDADNLPSRKVFDLMEQIHIDLKAVDSLITPTRFKLVDLGTLHYKSAALNAAVELNVAEVIEVFGGEVTLEDLAKKLDVNEHKLGIDTATGLGMECATGIPKDLSNPETKHSFADTTAPFCKVVSKNGQTFAQYMGNPENAAMVELGNEGIVGWLNKLTRAALLCDYPWAELGSAKVIDLGSGTGDCGMDLMRKFPQFSWVYQDLEPVIESLKRDFPRDLIDLVDEGRISFVVQDYFQPNASDGNVWYMRGVLHEYNDDQVLAILNHLTTAMRRTPNSKMIINEVLNSSPIIVPTSSMSAASEHIPGSQSAMASTANIMTWSTFSLFGGKERSYQEYEILLNTAGLKISRFFQFRTFTVMLECVLA